MTPRKAVPARSPRRRRDHRPDHGAGAVASVRLPDRKRRSTAGNRRHWLARKGTPECVDAVKARARTLKRKPAAQGATGQNGRGNGWGSQDTCRMPRGSAGEVVP